MSPKLGPESIPQLDINTDAPKFVRVGDDIYWENPPTDHKGIIQKYGITDPNDAGNMAQVGDDVLVWNNSFELPLGYDLTERATTNDLVRDITEKT
jgi:hypothetical protein